VNRPPGRTLYKASGEEDPFGAKAWPASYLAAQRLLAEGLQGHSVLELGCGAGLVSIVARLGGARLVLATDRAQPNVDRTMQSAELNGVSVCGELFDVQTPLPLPSRSSPWCGHLRAPARVAACAAELPEVFDFVVFSDVLYWPKEAAAFGRRAAEAYAAGSTVVVVDPGRRREDFLAALRDGLERRGVDPLPDLTPAPTSCPGHVQECFSKEVQTASSLFCTAPFELVLRPPAAFGRSPEPHLRSAESGMKGPSRSMCPTTFELVD